MSGISELVMDDPYRLAFACRRFDGEPRLSVEVMSLSDGAHCQRAIDQSWTFKRRDAAP